MKKTQVQLFVLAVMALVGLALTGCLKSNSGPSYQPSQNEVLLSSKAWKISQITIPQYGNSGPDSSILKSCHTQAQILFGQPASANSVAAYLFRDAVGGCDSNAFHYGVGVWAFKGSDSIYTQFTNQDYSVAIAPIRRMKILQLTDSIFQVRFIDSMKENANILKTITFIH